MLRAAIDDNRAFINGSGAVMGSSKFKTNQDPARKKPGRMRYLLFVKRADRE